MDRDELIRIYHLMLTIRRFEDRAGFAFTQGKVGGYLHLYIGQEAVAVGFITALRPGDYVMDSYRDHAHYLALGATRTPGWPSCSVAPPAARAAKAAPCTCSTGSATSSA